jgi:hypothetical protein
MGKTAGQAVMAREKIQQIIPTALAKRKTL